MIMKKLFVLITLFSFNTVNAQWTKHVSGTNNRLNSVFFVGNIGYVVGDSGTILKTIDKGDSWISQISGTPEVLESVCFINEDTGYVAGGGGIILKTIDGGINWISQISGTSLYVLN